MAKDLYDILGVDRNVSDRELKSAYRKLARQYHPDVNKEPDAQEKFTEVQKAYDVLSNPQKKAQYDQFGVTDDQGFGGGGPGGAGFEGFGGFDDIFDVFFNGRQRGGAGGGRSRARQGDDLRYDMEISLEDVVDGVSRDVEVFHLDNCSRCDGTGAQPGTAKSTCSTCGGQGEVRQVQQTMLGSFSQVSVCPSCHGAGEMIKNPCLVCHGRGTEKQKKKLSVMIPAGVDSGAKLRVSGEGNAGEHGGPAGDLYVFITVKPHDYFRRDGDNLYLTIDVSMTDAVLGTQIEVPTIDSSAQLRIPEGTQPGTKFRLKGKGIKPLRGYGRGDQFVEVKVVVPKKLSSKQKDLVKQLAELEDAPNKQSLFERVRRAF